MLIGFDICYKPSLFPLQNYRHQKYGTVKSSFLYLLQTIPLSTAKLSSSEIRHCEVIIPIFATNHPSFHCKTIVIRNTALWNHHSYICYKPSLFPLQNYRHQKYGTVMSSFLFWTKLTSALVQHVCLRLSLRQMFEVNMNPKFAYEADIIRRLLASFLDCWKWLLASSYLMFTGPCIVLIFWYIIPTRCTSNRVYLIWQLLYMFRASLLPICRSTKQL